MRGGDAARTAVIGGLGVGEIGCATAGAATRKNGIRKRSTPGSRMKNEEL
jgi:hypothetical protein